MNEQAIKIQAIIDTLQGLSIQSTFDNVNHLMGIFSALVSIRDELNKTQDVIVDLKEVKPETEEAKEKNDSEE